MCCLRQRDKRKRKTGLSGRRRGARRYRCCGRCGRRRRSLRVSDSRIFWYRRWLPAVSSLAQRLNKNLKTDKLDKGKRVEEEDK